ncbi:MAG: prepilin-type N-terminal cleavage/methylation domain-containing protein [Myxococcota bacterium]
MKQRYKGITLLEVLVALAVLSTFLFVLLNTQTQFLRLSSKARALIIATSLANDKMYDCKHLLASKNLDEAASFHERGDFSKEGHPGFTWECHAYPFDIPTPNLTQAAMGIGQQGSDKAQQDFGMPGGNNISAAAFEPMIKIVTQAFRKAVRELVTIIRWPDDELRMTTHVVDMNPIKMLSRSLPEPSALFPGLPGQQQRSPAAAPQPNQPQPGG